MRRSLRALTLAWRASAPTPRPHAPGSTRCAAFGSKKPGLVGKKVKESFLCTECGEDFAQSHGKCPACGTWDSLRPFKEPVAGPAGGGGAAARAVARTAPPSPSEPASARSAPPKKTGGWVAPSGAATSLADLLDSPANTALQQLLPLQGPLGAELSRVLGGGVVPGSLVLVGGDPGVGKSTLLLQLAGLLAAGADAASGPVLYVSGEESQAQVAARASRLGLAARQGAQPSPADSLFLRAETSVDRILEEMAALRPRAVIVDSIQTVYLEEVTGSAGSVSQVRECATALLHAAKRSGAPVFLVGHVTKSGDIAGPRTLEHIVDVVLYLEGEALREFRVLRGVKNRYGSTDDIGLFAMETHGLAAVANPGAAFLSRPVTPAGVGAATCVTCGPEGASRPMALEVQALAVPTAPPAATGATEGASNFRPAMRSATGVRPQRLSLLLAVLAKRALGSQVYTHDVFVNVVGGILLEEPAADLAICLAIAAAFRDAPLPGDAAFFGEVGLGGELRPVPQLERRALEAARLGFKRCIVPASGAAADAAATVRQAGCELVQCTSVAAAVEAVLGAPAKRSRGKRGAGEEE